MTGPAPAPTAWPWASAPGSATRCCCGWRAPPGSATSCSSTSCRGPWGSCSTWAPRTSPWRSGGRPSATGASTSSASRAAAATPRSRWTAAPCTRDTRQAAGTASGWRWRGSASPSAWGGWSMSGCSTKAGS